MLKEFMVWARVKCSKDGVTAMLNKGLLTFPLPTPQTYRFSMDFFFSVSSISASLKSTEDYVIWEAPAEKKKKKIKGIFYVR